MNEADRLTAVGAAAAALIENGMIVGIGTGSTAEAFIRALGKRVQEGLSIQGVPTSRRTETLARDAGIPLTTISDNPIIDLGVDGADEIDPHLSLIKGRGGALLHEKMIAESCKRWIIVAASEKLVPQLGTRVSLPIEIIPFGWETTQARVQAIGHDAPIRATDDGSPFLTDGRHFILDCATGLIDDPRALADTIKHITGVIDHGLFIDLATLALVCDPDGTVREVTAS